MKRLVLAAIAALCVVPSIADAEEIKLDMNQVITVLTGLKALDGYQKVVKDGEKETVVTSWYQLGGGLRLSIARTESKLNAAFVDFRAARTALLAETPGADKAGTEAARKFEADTNKMATEKAVYDIPRIKADELKLDVNPIPASVLSQLDPILAP